MLQLPTTRWSIVLSSRGDTVHADAALADLCKGYRAPILRYLCRQLGDRDLAEDLTQSFFEHFLAQRLHARADPGRGRFRVFLLRCVRNFMLEQRSRELAKKRGLGQQHVELDQIESLAAETDGPEMAFERAFAQTVMSRSRARLQQEALNTGKGDLFSALERFLVEQPEPADYQQLTEALGLRRNTLAVAVYRLRQRFQELVRAELAETLLDPAELDDEMAVMRRALGRSDPH